MRKHMNNRSKHKTESFRNFYRKVHLTKPLWIWTEFTAPPSIMQCNQLIISILFSSLQVQKEHIRIPENHKELMSLFYNFFYNGLWTLK